MSLCKPFVLVEAMGGWQSFIRERDIANKPRLDAQANFLQLSDGQNDSNM